ncbi:hypothetical protein EAH79_16205 [Sphingomonas koreensis]|nr:hypothetical protein EAH79_16205 [Sphingomonas koreensis]
MTELNRDNTAEGRDPLGRFTAGNPGKPKGATHKMNAAVLAALGDLTSNAMRVLKDQLALGNLKAATYILDRYLPSERVVALESVHPDSIADALAHGEATPSEAAKMAATFKTVADASEVKELRARLDEIESLIAASKK